MKITYEYALNKKKEFQNEFKSFSKQKDSTKEDIKALASKLWNEFETYSHAIAEHKKKLHCERKVHYLSNNDLGLQTFRSMSGIPKLRLLLPLNIVSVLVVIVMTITTVLMSLITASETYIVLSIISLSLVMVFELIRMTKYNIPKPYESVNSIRLFVKKMNSIDRYARSLVFYKNGKVKKAKYRTQVTEQYKYYVISNMPNPYEVETKSYPLSYRSFRTSGGIYAWIYEGNVVYIGLTNNFSNRMRQHYKGFFNEKHSELKYNTHIHPDNVYIKILAETDVVLEQRVLESFYYHKFKPSLNSCEPTKFERILREPKYREVWDRLKDKVSHE